MDRLNNDSMFAIRFLTVLKEMLMKWETPCAIDLRFGMEITMYIANR